MTSTQIRQSFLNFFKSKQHTIVPSSSLMPDSPNLLFTNAGMNQFVPIFLGQTKCPYTPGRAADTQKCIRAGGKHNDLDDVGLDTYHHTFFEMLGNWSFGDYFKPEAIDWAWELVVKVWKFPPQRLYATVFCPYLGEPGWEQKWAVELEQVLVLAMTSPTYIPPNLNASPFEIADQEAAMFWVKKFQGAGCDPKLHIVPGNKKDNFWMMGETGPCGPCTEIHVDLTPDGNTRGSLVNKGDARCIEIWNNVFIQFNAEPDGPEEAAKMLLPDAKAGVTWRQRFVPLPAKHVDTGMGFERVTSIIQGTKGLADFKNAKISNYETDIFRPIFDALEKLSGEKYNSTLPTGTRIVKVDGEEKTVPAAGSDVEAKDIAFRVIADHIRTLSFSIADGIQPGNTDRNYVLRRILRRAVRYGRTLGFHEPFFYKLVDVLAVTMGDIFPEIRAKQKHVQEVLRIEEEAFNKTLDNGIERFESMISAVRNQMPTHVDGKPSPSNKPISFPGNFAFVLYDTYGFPIDLTELMAREQGLGVDKDEFDRLMEEQRNRARAAQKKEVITLSEIQTTAPTKFVGYDHLAVEAKVLETVMMKDKTAIVLDTSTAYAEMGGQVGDTGAIFSGSVAADVSRLKPSDGADSRPLLQVTNTQKSGNTWLHFVESEKQEALPAAGSTVTLVVDVNRRRAIERHHTVTHLLHWALHEVASKEASQKGSFVGPDKLTFDFNSAPLTPAQVADIEKLVNERIVENAGVSWTEVLHNDVKGRKDVMQFFGEKYGDTVRVVQIGGEAGQLNGYSMELCGGTHTRATGEIGLFRIVGESAIAAGVRRIEAVAGLTAYDVMKHDRELIKTVAGKINSPVHELEKKIESLLAQQKELEKSLKSAQQREATEKARVLIERQKAMMMEWQANASNISLQPMASRIGGIPWIIQEIPGVSGDLLQALVDAIKQHGFKGVVVLGTSSNESVVLIASVSVEYTAKVQAGKIIQTIAPIVGGKGGGKPDSARGGGKESCKLGEALKKAIELVAVA